MSEVEEDWLVFQGWLVANELKDYEKQFKDSGVERLDDLGADVLGDDHEEIREWITEEIGETDESKVNKIYNAINALQAKLTQQQHMKGNENNNTYNHGFNFYEMVKVENMSDIKKVLANNHINDMIIKYEKQYYDIDVRDATFQLAATCDLLQIAYASSNGFDCHPSIASLLTKYFTLVKYTYVATGQFVLTSLNSLGNHKTALDILPKDAAKAIEIIGSCSQQAGEMAEKAKKLEQDTEKLTNDAEETLTTAVNDQSLKAKEKTELLKKIKKAKKIRLRYEKQKQDLENLSTHFYKSETETKEEMDNLSSALSSLESMMNTIITESSKNVENDIVSGDDDDAKDVFLKQEVKWKKMIEHKNALLELEDEWKKMLGDKEQLLRYIKAERDALKKPTERVCKGLIKSAGDIEDGEIKKNNLQMALDAIEEVVRTLGRIKVIFSNVEKFWTRVKQKCDKLLKVDRIMNILKDSAQRHQKQVEEEIIKSGKAWFTLTKVNCEAKDSISEVYNGMDEILQNLPNESESKQLVDTVKWQMDQFLAKKN
eukprot:317780_1